MRPLLAAAALGLGLVGCDGDVPGETDVGDTDPPTDTDEPKTYDPTWAGVEELFVDHCDRCHPSVAGFDLHDAIPPDIENNVNFYVTPGDPLGSQLWVVVGTGTLSFMPQDGQLPIESVDHVRVWIEDGASLN